MSNSLPPMPSRVMDVQKQYARLLSQVDRISEPYRIAPQIALLLAHIGDEKLSPTVIMRRGYWMGTNVTYPINQLCQAGFAEKSENADRRCITVSLTPKGRALAGLIVEALSERKRVAA